MSITDLSRLYIVRIEVHPALTKFWIDLKSDSFEGRCECVGQRSRRAGRGNWFIHAAREICERQEEYPTGVPESLVLSAIPEEIRPSAKELHDAIAYKIRNRREPTRYFTVECDWLNGIEQVQLRKILGEMLFRVPLGSRQKGWRYSFNLCSNSEEHLFGQREMRSVLDIRTDLKSRQPEENKLARIRLKLFAWYLEKLEEVAADPKSSVQTFDISGAATGFSNWLYNPLYKAVLAINQENIVAYRKKHGASGIGVQRNFLIDPTKLSAPMVSHLQALLDVHVASGITAGVMFRDVGVPEEVMSDMAILGSDFCLDYGKFEGLDDGDVEIRRIRARRGEAAFNDIQERVSWTMEQKNLDLVICREEHVDEVIRNLKERLKSLRVADRLRQDH